MAESLALTRDELRGQLGFELGWGRDESDWDDYKIAAIDSAVRSGLRRFLLNTVSPGTRKNYRWSFLRQNFPFTTAADVYRYNLPSDFGHVDGHLLHDDATVSYPPLRIVNESMFDQLKAQNPAVTGLPTMGAVRARRTDVAEQQYELLLYPTPGDEYDMKLGYHVNPEMISDDMPHLPGGPAMARAIKYACLAEMGHLVDDSARLEAVYQDALAAAISYDSRQDGGFLGINSDPDSDREDMDRHYRTHNPNAFAVTIDGSAGV